MCRGGIACAIGEIGSAHSRSHSFLTFSYAPTARAHLPGTRMRAQHKLKARDGARGAVSSRSHALRRMRRRGVVCAIVGQHPLTAATARVSRFHTPAQRESISQPRACALITSWRREKSPNSHCHGDQMCDDICATAVSHVPSTSAYLLMSSH